MNIGRTPRIGLLKGDITPTSFNHQGRLVDCRSEPAPCPLLLSSPTSPSPLSFIFLSCSLLLLHPPLFPFPPALLVFLLAHSFHLLSISSAFISYPSLIFSFFLSNPSFSLTCRLSPPLFSSFPPSLLSFSLFLLLSFSLFLPSLLLSSSFSPSPPLLPPLFLLSYPPLFSSFSLFLLLCYPLSSPLLPPLPLSSPLLPLSFSSYPPLFSSFSFFLLLCYPLSSLLFSSLLS